MKKRNEAFLFQDLRKLLLNSLSFCVFLIPFSLLTGPFLPDLFLSISVIIFLTYSILSKNFKLFKSNFFILFLIFYFFLILSSVLSDELLFSLKTSSVYFRYGIFSLAVWFLLIHQKKFFYFFKISIFISFIIALLFGYFHYFFELGEQNNTRLTLLLSDNYLLGNYLARLLPLVVALYIFDAKNFYSYIVVGLLFIVTDCLIYISGERTALGLLLLSSVFILLLINRYRITRILSFIISLIIIVMISVSSPQIKERNIDTTLSQIGISNNGLSDNNLYLFSSIHETLYRTSIKIFQENPILGTGPNTFRKFCNDQRYYINQNSCSTHPHNIYVQFLSEIGLIGIIPIIFVIFYLLNFIINIFWNKIRGRASTVSDYQICLLACFIINLWPFIPTLNFFNNWFSIVFYLPVGFLLYSLDKENNNNESTNLKIN